MEFSEKANLEEIKENLRVKVEPILFSKVHSIVNEEEQIRKCERDLQEGVKKIAVNGFYSRVDRMMFILRNYRRNIKNRIQRIKTT